VFLLSLNSFPFCNPPQSWSCLWFSSHSLLLLVSYSSPQFITLTALFLRLHFSWYNPSPQFSISFRHHSHHPFYLQRWYLHLKYFTYHELLLSILRATREVNRVPTKTRSIVRIPTNLKYRYSTITIGNGRHSCIVCLITVS
jgi:hypothetical protein